MRIIAALFAVATGFLCVRALAAPRRSQRRRPLDPHTIIALLRARDRARLSSTFRRA
jgi:hypothetical protein